MIRVDYTTLDQPALRLTLHRSAGGYYSVTDQNGRLFFPPSELDICVKFMRAMAKKRDAVLDEDSIEYARCEREFGDWSLRVPSSGEAELARTDGNQPLASRAVADHHDASAQILEFDRSRHAGRSWQR